MRSTTARVPTPRLLRWAASLLLALLLGLSPASDLPQLMRPLYTGLAEQGQTKAEEEPEKLVPAVPIKKSIQPDHLICLEDGKKLKMLKRHLMTAYGMTPEDYRAKWGLRPDYPMVAPNYALKRQELAKKIGLGRKPKAK